MARKRSRRLIELYRGAACMGVIASLLLSAAQELGSETLVMTATYPSPVGIYARLITTGGAGGLNTEFSRNGSNVIMVNNATNSGGMVGIGTASPSYKLDVRGDVGWSGTLLAGNVPWARLSSYPANNPCPPGQFVTGVGSALTCAPGGGVSITAGNAGIIVSPSPLTGTGTISLATQGCPSGQALQSIGGTFSCVSVSGGSSGITSVNGMTGPAISIAAGSGISISNSANTVTITNTGGGGGGGGGTVTSISQGGGILASPNPITGSGTVSLADQSCPAGQVVTGISGGAVTCAAPSGGGTPVSGGLYGYCQQLSLGGCIWSGSPAPLSPAFCNSYIGQCQCPAGYTITWLGGNLGGWSITDATSVTVTDMTCYKN